MDLSQVLFNSLLGDSSLKTLSKNSGASQDQVQQVMGLALPVLMKNMQSNASTKKGETSLAKALADHGTDDVSNISAFLANVDLEDGNKILSHILGKNKETVEEDIADQTGLTSTQTSGILANVAPLLLSLLGGSLLGGQSKGSATSSSNGLAGGLAGMLASALFGGGSSGSSSGGGGGLEDLLIGSLGSVLGGALTQENTKKKTTAKKTTTKSTAKKTTSKSTAKSSTKKSAAKKAEPDNVLDTLIGSLLGIDGKEK